MEILKNNILEKITIMHDFVNSITDEKILKVIYDLVINKIEFKDIGDFNQTILGDIYFFHGRYFNKIDRQEEKSIYYYKLSADNSHFRAIRKLWNYYRYLGDDFNTKLYFKMGIDKGVAGALFYYGKYLKSQKDYNGAIEKFLINYSNGDNLSLYFIGSCYFELNDMDNAIKYLKLDGELNNNSKAYNLLGIIYQDINIQLMKDYYELAIQKGSRYAAYNMAIFYLEKNDEVNVVKYFNKAMELGDRDSTIFLKKYYRQCEDRENEFKCVVKLLKFGYSKYIKRFNELIINNFSVEIALEFKNLLSTQALHKLNKISSYYLLFNKFMEKSSFNFEINKCFICIEDEIVLRLRCNHYVCYKCYNKISECPFCRGDKK